MSLVVCDTYTGDVYIRPWWLGKKFTKLPWLLKRRMFGRICTSMVAGKQILFKIMVSRDTHAPTYYTSMVVEKQKLI